LDGCWSEECQSSFHQCCAGNGHTVAAQQTLTSYLLPVSNPFNRNHVTAPRGCVALGKMAGSFVRRVPCSGVKAGSVLSSSREASSGEATEAAGARKMVFSVLARIGRTRRRTVRRRIGKRTIIL